MKKRAYTICAFLLGLGLAMRAEADEGSLRFRSGISAGGGIETIAGNSFAMGGIDGRLGAQLSEHMGLYVAPHLSYGSGSIGGVSGSTGTFAFTALADYTFIERLFVAGGGGYGVLNNPSGPVLHFRLGGYPLLSEETDGQRKGLVVALDSRTFFASGLTVEHIMVSLGYEKF